MKKTILFVMFMLLAAKIFAQSSTILPNQGISVPQFSTAFINGLTTQPKGTVVFDSDLNMMKYWDGATWQTMSGSSAGVGWAANGNNISNTNSGNVGIGTTTPTFPLTIQTASALAVGSWGFMHQADNIQFGDFLYGTSSSNGGVAEIGTRSNHPLWLFTNNTDAPPAIAIGTNQNIGFGTTSPQAALHILGGTNVYPEIRLENNQGKVSIIKGTNYLEIDPNDALFISPHLNGVGLSLTTTGVGIATNSPANKLQVGSVGSTGFSANHIAFGNGTDASAFFQNTNYVQWFATKDIIIMPRNGISSGKVGIGTTSPQAGLHVASFAPVSSYWWRSFDFANNMASSTTTRADFEPSILAEGDIVSLGAVASIHNAIFSDARIKNIIGKSNSEEDLMTINRLQITNYTMKDKAQFGIQAFKKVIAQEVEKVFPQAVSQRIGVLPDIYVLAENVVFDESKKELTVSLLRNYDIKIGEKIEFVLPKEGKIKAEVVAVSGNNFTVKDWKYPTEKLFVYGREVNDFRSVDYEAISMLGISAIQELAKKNEELVKEIKKINTNSQQLNARLEAIENLLSKSQNGN